MRNLREFLAEMGGAFTFVGNQFRLAVDGKDYFIDLLLFYRRLRCLVAIELKIGGFKPEHKGQIEFYLDQLDQHHRLDGENPPIGSSSAAARPARWWSTPCAPVPARWASPPTVTPQLPAHYAADLPSPEQIAQRLQGWELEA